MLLRLIRLIGLNGSCDQAVMLHDFLRLAGRRQMDAAQAVDMSAAAAHQTPDSLLVGCRIEKLMEVVVGGHEAFEITGFGQLLLLINRALQIGDE